MVSVYCNNCCKLFKVESEEVHPGNCPTCQESPCIICGKPMGNYHDGMDGTCSKSCTMILMHMLKRSDEREKEMAEEAYLRAHRS